MRHSVRSLVRQPGPVLLAVGILALGLGVNTAVLAVAYGVLWRPLPYPDAHRLITVALLYREDASVFGEVRLDQLDTWNRSLRTARVAGHDTRERVVRGAGRILVTEVATVAGDLFGVLGRTGGPSRARMLEREAGRLAARRPTRAVIGFPSPDARRRRPPRRARFPGACRTAPPSRPADATRVFRGRSPPAPTWPGPRPDVAACLVVVVAGANAATLLIGRSVLRRREFAIRIALGSGVARLIRAALAEGLAIAGGALILGLAAAWAGLRAFAALAAGAVPRIEAVGWHRPFDLPVVLAGLLLTAAAGVACGGASAAGALPARPGERRRRHRGRAGGGTARGGRDRSQSRRPALRRQPVRSRRGRCGGCHLGHTVSTDLGLTWTAGRRPRPVRSATRRCSCPQHRPCCSTP